MGALAGIILPLGTDAVMRAIGTFAALGREKHTVCEREVQIGNLGSLVSKASVKICETS